MALSQNEGFCQKKFKSQMPYDIQAKPAQRKVGVLASTSGPGEAELGCRMVAVDEDRTVSLEMHGCQSGNTLVRSQCF